MKCCPIDLGLMPDTPLVKRGDCPDRDKHTPCPEGYTHWHEWAAKMMKTHSQVQCLSCGRWSIWLPKSEARVINAAERKAEAAHCRAYKRMWDARKKARKK